MIFLTHVTQPERGAIMVVYCKHCRRTEITVSEYANRPEDGGDLWLVQMPCLEHAFVKEEFEMPPWNRHYKL